MLFGAKKVNMSYSQNKNFFSKLRSFNRWKDVITTSTKTMIKLPIYDAKYDDKYGEILSDLVNSERKFTSIVMTEMLTITSKYFEQGFKFFLSAKGENIRHFSITSNVIHLRFFSDPSSKEITSALKFLPNLEHLDLSLYLITLSEKVTMNKLKSLKTWNVDLLKFIEAPQLTKLNLTSHLDTHGKNVAVEYLRKLTHLKQLSVDEDLLNFEKDEIEFSFKLKKLKFNGCTHHGLMQDKSLEENSMKFLRQQGKTLINLQIPKGLPLIFIREIFTTFENLKWLHLDPLSLPKDENFYKNLKPLENVWFLKLDCGFGNHGVAEAFHALFPKLKSFKLRGSANLVFLKSYYVFLMKFHKNIEHLNFPVFIFDRDTRDICLFENLKSLEFKEVCCYGLQFILRHQHLEKLSFQIRDLERDQKDDVSVHRFMELPNLKSLKVRGSLLSLKKFYDFVKADYKNLSDVTFETFHPTVSIKIEFPNDRKYFNSEVYDAFFQKN